MKEQHEFDNHANQLNPNNGEYYRCREDDDWDDFEDECDNNVLDEDIVEEYRDYSND